MPEKPWPPQYPSDYIPHRDQEHWSPELETMSPDQRDGIVLDKLREQVRYVYRHSGFYREFYADVSVDPENLRTLAEFAQLPILTKDDIRREQEVHPPYGRFLCIPPSDVFRVHGTSGTTGRPRCSASGETTGTASPSPTPHPLGSRPSARRHGDGGRCVQPLRRQLGGACWSGTARRDMLSLGSGAPGQTERAAEWCAMVKPSALYGTPSYALYLAETARQMGLDPLEDFGFRFMFFSGEPGASVPATRRLIEDTFGCYVVDQGSMAEMTPWMSNSGCRHLATGMHLWQDIVYTELVDPESRKNLPLGAEGVPVYSHTERTSQPMIRYWSGDIARWDMVDCPCGRTYPTLVRGIYGRADDMIIVRGQNVFPSRIEDILRSLDVFGGEFRLLLERERGQLDRLTVQTEVLADTYILGESNPAALEQVQEEITAALRRALGVGVAVELKPAGEFERTQFKARRIIDRRTI